MTSSITTLITDNTASTQAPKTRRQVGYDVARALAIIGMVIVNFKLVMSTENSGAQWLIQLAGLLEGRAAAIFVILAGVGISLLSRRAREQGDAQALAENRKTLIKRAAFLFCFGLIFATVWPPDILRYYGIYFVFGIVFINASNRILWIAAIEFTFAFYVLQLFFDYEKDWIWETLDYESFWTFEGMLRNLFFNGFHPVIPWTAFLLVGIWLGRQNLTDSVLRLKIIVWSLVALVLTEAVSHFLPYRILSQFFNMGHADITAIFSTAPMPPMPFYLISAGSSALIVIILCILITEKFSFKSNAFKPLIVTGQLALTLYVAHVVVGMGLLEVMGKLYNQSITMAVSSALCFTIAAMVFAVIWHRFFNRGPLEWMMRALTK